MDDDTSYNGVYKYFAFIRVIEKSTEMSEKIGYLQMSWRNMNDFICKAIGNDNVIVVTESSCIISIFQSAFSHENVDSEKQLRCQWLIFIVHNKLYSLIIIIYHLL